MTKLFKIKTLWLVPLLVGLLAYQYHEPPSRRYKPIELNSSYEHNKWGVEPHDLLYQFAAYTSSFDSNDDDNGDGQGDIWGIPEWVAYEIKADDGSRHSSRRPSKWMTDTDLHDVGIAPDDKTYAVSGTRDLKIVSTDYRFVRGHMCPKSSADRVSKNAAYNTHTVLNAVPQLQWQNNGVWKDLEQKCNTWANQYGRIWVVCGPVFFDKTPALWLGQTNEVKAAVPDALYKVIIRKDSSSETGLSTLTFIIPNIVPKTKKEPSHFLSHLGQVEDLTDLEFLTTLSKRHQRIEKRKHKSLDISEASQIISSWQ